MIIHTQIAEKCPRCYSDDVDGESQTCGKHTWEYYWCNTCDHIWNTEPDWDEMKGGADYDG